MYDDVLDKEKCPYFVRPIPYAAARDFIVKHHYAKGCQQNQTAGFGLFRKRGSNAPLGVLMFACPGSENVRRKIFGPGHKDHVTGLHRFALVDQTLRFTESWMIAQCLRRLQQSRPDLWGVVSFSDPAYGHTGTIYQATNAAYSGLSTRTGYRYIDSAGRQWNRRQCGRNITAAEAESRGWRKVPDGQKHRYTFLLPRSRSHRRQLLDLYQLENLPYPRPACTSNGGA